MSDTNEFALNPESAVEKYALTLAMLTVSANLEPAVDYDIIGVKGDSYGIYFLSARNTEAPRVIIPEKVYNQLMSECPSGTIRSNDFHWTMPL